MARRVRRTSLAAWRRRAIRRMELSRQATLAFLARRPEQEVLRPRTQGRWSVKDVLAHIAAWEEEGVHRLELIARGRGDRIRFYDDVRAVDRFNARAVAVMRSTRLPALLRRLVRVRRHLVGVFRRLPPQALGDSSHEVPVVDWLPEFCWTHEQSHLRQLRAWWRSRHSRPRTRARGAAPP